MRHQKARGKLSRDSAHRKALLMNLSKEIIEHERIETSAAKAKAVKPEIERLITLAKRGDLHARRQALSRLAQDKFAVHKLFDDLAPRYAGRPGGYTRILRLGPRRSNGQSVVTGESTRPAHVHYRANFAQGRGEMQAVLGIVVLYAIAFEKSFLRRWKNH